MQQRCQSSLLSESSQLLWPLATTVYGGRRPQRGLCDFTNAVAFGHNELCRPMGAKVSIKLVRISPIGNTGVQSFYTGSSSSSSGAAAAAAAATASADTVVEQLQQQQHWQQAVGSGGAAAAVRGTAAAAATTYSHHTGQVVVSWARGNPGGCCGRVRVE